MLCLSLHIPPMQRVAAYRYLGPRTALSAASSSELTLASFKTPALEEAAAEMGGCSPAPSSHGLLLGSPKPLCRLRPHRGHVILSCKTPLQ